MSATQSYERYIRDRPEKNHENPPKITNFLKIKKNAFFDCHPGRKWSMLNMSILHWQFSLQSLDLVVGSPCLQFSKKSGSKSCISMHFSSRIHSAWKFFVMVFMRFYKKILYIFHHVTLFEKAVSHETWLCPFLTMVWMVMNSQSSDVLHFLAEDNGNITLRTSLLLAEIMSFLLAKCFNCGNQ